MGRNLSLWQDIASEASVPKPEFAKAVDPKPPPPKAVEPKKAAEPKLQAAEPKPKAVEPKPAKPKAVEPKAAEPKPAKPKAVEPEAVDAKKAVEPKEPQPPPPKPQAVEPQGGLHSFFARRAPPAQEVLTGARTSKSADAGPSEAILPSIEENEGALAVHRAVLNEPMPPPGPPVPAPEGHLKCQRCQVYKPPDQGKRLAMEMCSIASAATTWRLASTC